MSAYSYKASNLPKNTTEIALEITWPVVQAKRETVIDEAVKSVQVAGFRVGKAPRDLAVKQLDMERIYEQVVRQIIPDIYREIIAKEQLSPVTSPAIDLTEAKESESWKLKITVPLTPSVKMGNYKEVIKNEKLKIKNDRQKIQEEEKAKAPAPNAESQPDAAVSVDPVTPDDAPKEESITLSRIFEILLAESTVEIPDLLVQEEVDKRLNQLVDDIRKVGLTPQQYLDSRKMTEQELRAQYSRDSEDMLKIEFILPHIADTEDIKVDQSDLDALAARAQSDRERQVLEQNMSWYQTMLRKQKVLDFLTSL